MKKPIFTMLGLGLLAANGVNAESLCFSEPKIAFSQPDSIQLDEFVGKYKMAGLPFDYVEVRLQDGKLVVNANGEEGTLTPLKEPDTFDAEGKATLKFNRDAAKKIYGMTLDAQGSTFDGIKES